MNIDKLFAYLLILLAVAVIIAAILASVIPAFAQDPSTERTVPGEANPGEPIFPKDLPPTAAGAVLWIKVGLAMLAGLIANRLTEAVSKLPFLHGADREKLRQPLLDLTAAVLAIGSGYLLSRADAVAYFLDDSGWWQVVVWAWPAAYAWFLTQKFATNLGGLAKIAVVGSKKSQ